MSEMSKVVVVLPMVHPRGEQTLEAAGLEVVHVSADNADIAAALADADAMIARGPAKVSGEVLEQGSRLKVVSASGAGYDCIDVEAATRLGLPLLHAPGVGAPAVAEWVLGALVTAGRRLPSIDAEVRKEFTWSRRAGDLAGIELRGKTLGLIGIGNIGGRVARLAGTAFEMNVVAYDPAVDALDGVTMVGSADELVAQADFLSLHIPFTPETAGMLDARRLALMKPSACLINASRGGVVDDAALAEALTAGRLRYAVVDVVEGEPAIWESPLVDAPNCVLSAHVAGLTDRAIEDLAVYVAEGVVRALDGELDRERVVNLDVLGSAA
jgi:D-3-phosphoglycerate dehydrogenase